MLTNRKSNFLLIRVNTAWKFPILVPLPFYALDIILDAVGDVLAVFDFLFLWLTKKYCKNGFKGWAEWFSLRGLLGLFREFLLELRRYGRLRIVEVQTDDVKVYIDLY